MASTWLRKRRDAIPGMTQDALAEAVQLDKRAIGRLERCEPEALERPPYDRLAKALEVSVIALADDHARDLRALGQHERAEHARKVAADAWRKQRFSPVDADKLAQALVACESTGLVAGMAKRKPQPPDVAAQATHLAELLRQDHMDRLFNLSSIPLERAIAAASNAQQLDALHGFLTEVARQSAAEDSKLDTGGEWHQLPDGTHAWTIRALIDRSCDLDGMRLVRPGPEEGGSRFDDGPDSTLAVRSGHVTQANADARLHELVLGIGDLLPTVKRAKPGPADAAALEEYCKVVNQELMVHNNTHGHVLGIWDPATMEAPEVKERLLLLLPNLRLFACTPDLGERPLLRVNQDGLEGWFVSNLRLIDQRRRALGGSGPAKPKPSSPPPAPAQESQPMPGQKTQSMRFENCRVAVSTGDHSPATQANDQAAVNQINATASNRELLQALEQLLANTDLHNAAHAPLRKATRALQGELEETGRISPPAVQRFERAKEGVSLTEQAISIVANVAGLLAMAGVAS